MAQPKLISVAWTDAQAGKLVAIFDQAMSQDSVFFDTANWYFYGPSGASAATISGELGLDRALITLAAEVQSGLSIDIEVDTGMRSLAGELMDPIDNILSFTTEGAAPVPVSATPASTTTIDLVFNEDVGVATAGVAANYQITSNDGTRALSVSSVSMPAANTVRIETDLDMTHDASYTLEIINVADLAGNAIDVATIDFAGLGVQPSVSGGTFDAEAGTFIVSFSQDMRRGSTLASRFSYAVLPDAAGAAAVYVKSVKVYDARTVILTLSDTTIGKAYRLRCAETLVDSIGSPINPAGLEHMFTGAGEAPKIQYVTAVGPNRVDVKFSKPLQDNASIRDTATWSFTGGLQVLQANLSATDRSIVQLVTTDFVEGAEYDLTVSTV